MSPQHRVRARQRATPHWLELSRQIASLASERTPLRWVPSAMMPVPVRVGAGGVERESFIVTAPGRIDWTVYAIEPASIRTFCAIDGIEGTARLTIEASHGDERCTAAIDLDAGSGWRELYLRLPPRFSGETSIAFVATSPAAPGIRIACAGAVLARRRSVAELARAGLAAARLLGIGGFLRRAAAAAQQAEDDERYRHWLVQRPSAAATPPLAGPLISVLTPVFNTDPVWLRRCIDSVRTQTYQSWELILADDGSHDPRTLDVLRTVAGDPRIAVITCPREGGGIVRATSVALAAARGEFVAFLDHDDELAPGALEAVARAIAAQPDLDVVYTDEDKIDPSGVHSQPHFKPDWSPELLLSCMYTSHLTVMRRRVVEDAGGLRAGYDGSQDYDLMLRVAGATDRIAHVPDVLYHWRTTPLSAASSQLAKPWAARAAKRALEDTLAREGAGGHATNSAAAGHFRTRYPIAGAPRISVLLASDGVHPTHEGAMRALADAGAGRLLEVVFAGHGASGAAPHEALRGVPYKIVPLPGHDLPFGARVNALARAAGGDHFLLLDEAIEPGEPDWLEAMLEFSQRPSIGAVGAVLLRRDGTIEHAGLVLGAAGLAACAFRGERAWTRGHLANALDMRNYSAVSAACLLTRREVFERVGGFDEHFDAGAGAIDYGLKVRAAGLRSVVTPHARVGFNGPGILDAVPDTQAARLRARWGTRLDADPYYNPAFDRRAANYRLPPPPATASR